MKKRILAISLMVLAFSVVAVYAGAWLTNKNHHAQVRIPVGWNTEYEVINGPGGKQAHIILANDAEGEKLTMVTAIASIELDQPMDLDTFQAFFEKAVLENGVVVSKEKRGFNNLKGNLLIYDADMGGVPLRMMCFFTQKGNYMYAVFTGTEKAKFDERKSKLDEIIVTFQYVD